MARLKAPFRDTAPRVRPEALVPPVPTLRSPATPPLVMSSEPELMLIGAPSPVSDTVALLMVMDTTEAPLAWLWEKAKLPVSVWPRKVRLSGLPVTAR